MTAHTKKTSAYQKGNYTKLNTFTKIFIYNIKDFFYWWYIQMPTLYFRSLGRVLLIIDDNFSIGLLIQTFFVPWKRDKHLIGYAMGIAIRLLYLPFAITIYIITLLIYIILILFWILIPIMSVLFIFISFIM